jgi:hypothetical protein
MAGNSLFYGIFSLLLVFGILVAGCSDESSPAETETPAPAHPDAKYREGDIVAASAYSTPYIILKYDAAADEYTRALIEKNADGSWGYRPGNRTDKSSRAVLEKIYTVRVSRAAVSSVPVVTPTILPATTPFRAGNPPVISKISPVSATKDTVVSVTIDGTSFQDGATVKLVRAGSAPITASGVRVTDVSISCYFNLDGKSDGSYTLVVSNPDGQSDSGQGIFTIGEASPVIAGMYPVTAAVGDQASLSITGQNFRNEVKVSFTRGSSELVCDKPMTTDSTKITCYLDLAPNRGASAGEWNVTVLNIRDGLKGTWVKKFTVTRARED